MKPSRLTTLTLVALSAGGLSVTGLSGCSSTSSPSASSSTTSQPAAAAPAPVQPASGQPAQTLGYWPAEVLASPAPSLGQIVVDGQGNTLYRFDKDYSNPPKSTCMDACAQKWPPVLTRNKIRFSGIDRDQLGAVARPDGTYQVTIAGHPVYRFSGDTGPGQTNGQGVGGTWFVVSPTGAKAGNAG